MFKPLFLQSHQWHLFTWSNVYKQLIDQPIEKCKNLSFVVILDWRQRRTWHTKAKRRFKQKGNKYTEKIFDKQFLIKFSVHVLQKFACLIQALEKSSAVSSKLATIMKSTYFIYELCFRKSKLNAWNDRFLFT